MSMKDSIYKVLPISLQNLASSTYGYHQNKYRYNKTYYSHLSFFMSSDFFTNEQRTAYQREKLSSLLLSLKHNDYYSSILEEFNNIEIIDNPVDIIGKIPITSKETIHKYFNEISANVKDAYIVRTSGTTGKALKLMKTSNDMAAQTACWSRHRSRFGIKHKDQSVNFTGKLVVPSNQKKPPYWRYNQAWDQYLVNMQHINKENITSIVGFLNSISPKFYSGYPSIIADVASLAMEMGLELSNSSKPYVIFCGAENTYQWQKDKIEKWTGAIVTDLYGLTEGACNLSRCQYGYYHEDFELCYSELVDVENLESGKKRGKLVGTGFFLEAFPLLRYDTGDIAVQMPEEFLCPCGRHGKIYESISGRVDDYVLTPEGTKIMRFDYLFKDTEEIEEVQVIQKSPSVVLFKIKLRADYSNQEVEKVLNRRFKEWISKSMELKFEYVQYIEKSSTGKFKAVINEL